MQESEGKAALPYSSAATFITTLDHLGAVGIPNLIDRNALPPSFSGSSRYEMLGTLRFFELIDKEGRPDLDRLPPLTDSATRQEALSAILKSHYGGLFALPLSSAGPTEINRWFSENATASTVGKAKAFFLALAKQVGVQMHSMVAKGTRTATGSVRRKRRRKTTNAATTDPAQVTTTPQPTTADTAHVALPQVKDPALQALLGRFPEITTLVELERWYYALKTVFEYVHGEQS